MEKYRKRPVVIEAQVWLGWNWKYNSDILTNVKPYEPYSYVKCIICGKDQSEHGWIDTLEGGHIVCPGDWIIKGIKGEFYPCKPDIFNLTYELVDDEEKE